jgi:glycosidase
LKKLAALLITATLALLTACSTQPNSDSPQPENYLQNAVIYEVNTRQFTPEGSFKALEEQLPRLQDLGVDILWLMPIQPISKLNRKGILGSPYSVADYYGVNPELGTPQDFQDLVDAAHNLGLKVIIDWVANHSGWDNPWISQHPDWYTKDSAGDITIPIGTDWSDVADFNYDNQDLRNEMAKAMAFWVSEYDVDGFRADVAHSVPVEFWEQARTTIEQVKPVFMIAEDGGNLALLRNAFDTNYAWGMMGLFNDLGKERDNASKFRLFLKSSAFEYTEGLYQMVFTDNHDENSWNGTVFERMGDNVKNMAVLSFTIPGIPLIYGGQEIGLDRRLAFFEKDNIGFPEKQLWGTSDWEIFYKTLIDLRTNNPALWSAGAGGALKPLHYDNSDVIAFSRTVPATKDSAENTVLVLVNISKDPESQEINLGELSGTYKDFFSSEEITLSETQILDFEPHSFRVLVSQN